MKYLIILITALFIAGCRIEGGGAGSGVSGSSFAPSVSSGAEANIPLANNPEPSTLALLGIGLAGLVTAALRKRQKA